MPNVPASAFNEVFYRQVWVHDGVADARRARRAHRAHRVLRWRRKIQQTDTETLPQARVRIVSPIHPSLRHLAADRELRRV